MALLDLGHFLILPYPTPSVQLRYTVIIKAQKGKKNVIYNCRCMWNLIDRVKAAGHTEETITVEAKPGTPVSQPAVLYKPLTGNDFFFAKPIHKVIYLVHTDLLMDRFFFY